MAFYERDFTGQCLGYGSYDTETLLMILWFQDGRVYDYREVQPEMWALFDGPDAWGIIFNRDMRPNLKSYSKE